jgi:CRISPR/Cas system-associated exonuclease Cas4 (RecB family)
MKKTLNSPIHFLTEFCRAHLLDEKIFVVPSYQIGHQIGESLTKSANSWVNLRFVTLPSLAQEYAGFDTMENDYTQISQASAMILLNRVFSSLLGEGKLDYFGELKPSPGIIRALHESLFALRMAGITTDDLSADNFINEKKGNEIRLLLKKYEDELENKRYIDLPGLYALALTNALTPTGASNEGQQYFLILQNSSLSHLENEFLMKIAGENLALVPQDTVMGIIRPRHFLEIEEDKKSEHKSKPKPEPTPTSDIERAPWLFAPYKAPPPFKDGTLELTRAIDPSNECKEILRRVVNEKIPLDDVEVVCPQGVTYLSIFYVLSEKVDLHVTFADGIPPGFTSPGKIFRGILKWIEGNYLTSDLCHMIESGDLKLPTGAHKEDILSPQRTSRYLKRAMIGWGRDRYIDRLAHLKKCFERKADEIPDDEIDDRTHNYDVTVKEIHSVITLIKGMFDCIPDWEVDEDIDFKDLCQGICSFLKRFALIRNELDGEAFSYITAKLDEVVALETSQLSKEDAFERLRILLEGIRVGASGPQPGHLHLSSFGSGGFSGRPLTFVGGLNQENFPGAGYQDPFLLDEERKTITSALKTTEDILRENLYSMAALIASLRGRAVLSYSSYDIVDERPSFPSSLMLQAFRLVEGNPRLDYTELQKSLPLPSGFLPNRMESVFDDLDWWLRKLSSNGTLYDGRDVVRECFPELGRGMEALEIRKTPRLSPYEGIVDVDAREIHPVFNTEIVMSSSRLELLASCPFSYFLSYILGLEKPKEVEFDPSSWLDPMQRGSLIHEVFFVFMTELKKRGEKVDGEKHISLIRKIAEETIAHYKEEIPPPSEGIFEKERLEVMQAVELFLSAEEKLKERVEPLMFEVVFGIEKEVGKGAGKGIEEPVEVTLGPKSSILLRGRIDRIDRLSGNRYRVVDYKSGRYSQYENLACFGRGSCLQHALYALAAEAILKKTGTDANPKVIESGYYFPTRRGEGKEVLIPEFNREALKDLLKELLDIIERGHFICGIDVMCDYCDFLPICGKGAKDRAKAKRSENPDEFAVVDRLKYYD